MDYHVSGGVRFVKKDDTGLYRWCLQEINDRGEVGTTDYIPWNWSCQFEGVDLRVAHAFSLETDKASEPKSYILGKLKPSEDDRRDKRRYSFFGTGRTIKEFAVRIVPADEEYCEVAGIVSYTAEWDFENRTTNDLIQIDVAMSHARYADLAAFITSGYSSLNLSITGVSGFYSPWSPSIRTTSIKVLGDAKAQKLEIPDGSEIQPPTTRDVHEFYLHVTKADPLQAERKTLEIGLPDKSPETAQGSAKDAEEALAPAAWPEALESRFLAIEGKISRLLIPLWIAAAALMILIFPKM